MTKKELTENYTIEELADMVLKSQGKFDWLRTRCHEGARDFFDRDMYGVLHIVGLEELQKADFPLEPIDVASMLITARYERKRTPGEMLILCSIPNTNSEDITDTVTCSKYTKKELREIAEHLLVYCDNNEVHEE